MKKVKSKTKSNAHKIKKNERKSNDKSKRLSRDCFPPREILADNLSGELEYMTPRGSKGYHPLADRSSDYSESYRIISERGYIRGTKL